MFPAEFSVRFDEMLSQSAIVYRKLVEQVREKAGTILQEVR